MKISLDSCFILDTKMLKKNLRLAREHKSGLGGFIDISFEYKEKKTQADYHFIYDPEYDYLVIHYDGKEQKIKLAESQMRLGSRSWFVCGCGKWVGKLYLPELFKSFKCRHCCGFYYPSTRINKRSKHGKFLYKNSKMLKLIEMREKISRIFYKSQYTKAFLHWLKLCDEVGLTGERLNAMLLMVDIMKNNSS